VGGGGGGGRVRKQVSKLKHNWEGFNEGNS